MRRRRNEVSVELRKAKKDEQLLKRRNITLDDDEEPLSPHQDNVSSPSEPIRLDDIVRELESTDKVTRFVIFSSLINTKFLWTVDFRYLELLPM